MIFFPLMPDKKLIGKERYEKERALSFYVGGTLGRNLFSFRLLSFCLFNHPLLRKE